FQATIDPTAVWGSAATTLEYALADFAIARYARAIGEVETCKTYMERSHNWRHLLNPKTGYLQPPFADGSFLEELDPTGARGWVEGSTAQYTWFVPHDRAGLLRSMGSRGSLIARLDFFFEELNAGPVSQHAF